MAEPSTRARPVGRLARALTGAVLLGLVGSLALAVAPTALGLGAAVVASLVAFYLGLHQLVVRRAARVGRWSGAVLANGPVVAVFVLGGVPGRLGVATFVGASLLLAAWRADGGCEVLAIPGAVVGPRTHLACLAFTPLDWLERRLTRRR